MMRHAKKIAALLVTGGIVLQLGGCGGVGGLGGVLIQNLAGLIISALLSGFLGETPTA